MQPVALAFGWHGDYAQNYSQIKRRVKIESENNPIALVGISTGASLAIRLANELPNVTAVVTICGRITSGGFSLTKFNNHPAYHRSLEQFKKFTLTKRVMTITPIYDEIVPVNHMGYPRADELRVPYLFHIPSILRILKTRSEEIAAIIKTEE